MSRPLVAVFDDDPTGTQTVHGVPVCTAWDRDILRRAFREHDTVYLLTNSRGLAAAESAALHRELAPLVLDAAADLGREVELISRSDSTLRGHYPLETDVLRAVLAGRGIAVDAELLIPYFGPGGRVTEGDTHWVCAGDARTPVGETPFARDATFGFRSSDLRAWIAEKTGGAVPAEAVWSIDLDTIRQGGAAAVAERLLAARDARRIVVNATRDEDLATVCAAVHRARAAGRRFLYRTAASFVPALAGIRPRGLLQADELLDEGGPAAGHGGLVVVGSHVPTTNDQLAHLLDSGLVEPLELDAAAVLAGDAEALAAALVARIDPLLAAGRSVALSTSRTVQRGGRGGEDDLAIARRISRHLVGVVAGLRTRPRWLLAKGGITASDVAVHALAVRRALVLGQILPGVPVWRQGAEARFPGEPLIVFPGNVGGPDALTRIVAALSPTPTTTTTEHA